MRFLFIIILLCVSFTFGVIIGVYKYPPYQLIAKAKYIVASKALYLNKGIEKFDLCDLSTTSSLNSNSHVFIGHSYGSPSASKAEDFVSPNSENFIRKYSSKFKTLIFTGDVFKVPSIEKWKQLRTEIGTHVDVFIAPGNHDVSRPDSKNVFDISEFGRLNYPSLQYLDKTPLVLENSTQSNWHVRNSTIDLVNGIEAAEVIIARHHSPTEDLLSLVNSTQGKSNSLETIEELSQKFNKNRKYYWIIGDSGAHSHLPRLSCLVYENHTFLLNGLGQIEGDSIILYRDKKFLKFPL